MFRAGSLAGGGLVIVVPPFFDQVFETFFDQVDVK
jgi:hypothetical protein